MTDATTAEEASKPRAMKDEVIEDAVVVEETTLAAETPVVVETAHASATEPVVATTDPAGATGEQQRVVYVQVPAAPKKLGNRGVGALIAIVSGILFTAILALITAIIGQVNTGVFSFSFLTRAEFYIPTLFFVVAFVVLVLIVNRAAWWAYIIGSLIVGVVVYFGTVGLGLLSTGIVLDTPDVAAERFRAALGSPFIIVSALLAREVALWAGALISRRGRRLKVRNAETRASYDRELAEKRAEHERGATAAATAV